MTRRVVIEHDPGPSNVRINTMTIEIMNDHNFDEIMTKQELEEYVAQVKMMYKRKDKKIHPANVPLSDGINPGGGVNLESDEIDLQQLKLGVRSNSSDNDRKVPRGSRLTPKRLASMQIDADFLSEKEKQIFIDILYEFEGAIAFDDSEMRLLNPEIEPPIIIHTIPHAPWQQQNIRLPKAMQEIATRHVKEKLANGTLEFSQGPYRNRYFLVKKLKKMEEEYRFINDVQLLNEIMIRDSGMPPSMDEFSEDFADYPITSSIDYYSDYYQIPLDKTSRDYTAFLTEIDLVRMTRLPQGWTNSVASFQRVMEKIHYRQIPRETRSFIDDIDLKDPKDQYNDVEIVPGVRKFVLEHTQIFKRFMHDT